MKAFTVHKGIVIPLDRANVDTDAIIPKQFLKSIKRSGFGEYLFDEWRFLDHGEPGMKASERPLNDQFVLNQPQYQQGSILLARNNFGCGSSREHAVWAIEDYGIRAVIAPSFADIFFNNCFKNGVLPIVLTEEEVEYLFKRCTGKTVSITIDLPEQVVIIDDKRFPFNIDDFRKDCLLKGLDQIGLTLQHAESIKNYEKKRRSQTPWLFE